MSSLYDAAGDEYDVYIFKGPLSGKAQESWEKKRTTGNRLRALAAAKKLHATQKYQRVEIKKKAYDQKSRRAVVTTFKVYEGGNAAPKTSGIMTLMRRIRRVFNI